MKAILVLLLLSACADVPNSPEVTPTKQAQALTVCSPYLRYHLWLSATAKVPTDNCADGPYFRQDGTTAKSVFCWYTNADGTYTYRDYGIQRPGLNPRDELSFDNYSCEFNVCNRYFSSITCNCSYCYGTGHIPATL